MRSGRHWSPKRAQSAPSRRLPLTVGSAGLGSTSRDLSLQLPTGPCLVVRRTLAFFVVVVAAPLAAVTFALTTPPHRVRGERFSGVASMTDRLRPKPSASIYPDRVLGNRTHALSVWTYVTACKCGVHARWAGSSGPCRKFGTTAVTRRPHPVLVLEVASFAAVARSG